MYVPKHFQESDAGELAHFMAANGFAVLLTTDERGLPFGSHLPLLYDAGPGGAPGRIVGHMAKANPQWRHFRADTEVLAVFAGPHGYVSPAWYDSHPAVPTWNFAAVHAYGRPRLIDEPAEAEALLRRLVATYEAGRPKPWNMDGLPRGYFDGMLRGIQAFELAVTCLEGKFKLSQNRDATDRANVAVALSAEADGAAQATAALMRARAKD